ncbi:unnamed protein product [Euphydryas editha]|uniref:DUF4371 domain-containing protein n=1 Tax=Euphydryas editha TaxID=104508 RepID=A0AAU9ULW3_EUPED|nr:unnamed protein product [Euphydryas editha]
MGIGTDNAPVMVGVNNGVFSKLKEEVPQLILVRCLCHSLQLAVSAAAREFLPRNLEFLIRKHIGLVAPFQDNRNMNNCTK